MSGTVFRASVLVVEDNPAYQELYEEVLEAQYDVTVTNSKEDARHLLRTKRFDVAIIDMRLRDDEPENVDGLDIAELIRDLNQSTAMILKSGFPTDEKTEVASRMEKLNFVAVLDKSAKGQVQKLTEAVARSIERS